MSVNPNQSWITPQTSLFGQGGGSNFVNGITIGAVGGVARKLQIGANYYNQYQLEATDLSGTPQDLVTGTLHALYLSTPSGYQGAGNYQWNSINYQAIPTGNNTTFLTAINDELGSVNPAFSLNAISSINSGNSGMLSVYSPNIQFAGSNGLVRILPNTNQVNVQNLVYVSTINALDTAGTGLAGAINMTDLTSTIAGYGWARVGAPSP